MNNNEDSLPLSLMERCLRFFRSEAWRTFFLWGREMEEVVFETRKDYIG